MTEDKLTLNMGDTNPWTSTVYIYLLPHCRDHVQCWFMFLLLQPELLLLPGFPTMMHPHLQIVSQINPSFFKLLFVKYRKSNWYHKLVPWPGDLAQQVRSLDIQAGGPDLNSNTQNPCKKPGMFLCAYNPRGVGWGGVWGYHQPSSIFSERSCLNA